MGLNYPPVLGQILICDYRDQAPPEMTKRRLVVVMNDRLMGRDGLCAVIPLSTTPPKARLFYQCKIELPIAIDAYPGLVKWAKADMIGTVAYRRLSLPYRRPPKGRRLYQKLILPPEQLTRVRLALLHALQLAHLTPHLKETI